MIEQGHDSPEQAAMLGCPEAHCWEAVRERVVQRIRLEQGPTIPIWAPFTLGQCASGCPSVRVEFGNTFVEAPIHEKAYFLVWWRVPNPAEWPASSLFVNAAL